MNTIQKDNETYIEVKVYAKKTTSGITEVYAEVDGKMLLLNP